MTYLIGLDGGGSKTAGMLCDHHGKLLACHRAPGSAIVGAPSPAVCAALNAMIEDLCRTAGIARNAVAHVALGLSGIDFDDEIPGQHAALCAALGIVPGSLTLVNDAVTALWGVSEDHRLGLIQHGTGLTSAYRPALGEETIFDSLDVGAIYDVRRQAFSETARMLDGRSPRTMLADRILAYCAVTEQRFAEWVYRHRIEARRARAGCAGLVFEAWQDGDPAAAEMVMAAAQDYALLARAIGDRLGEGPFAVGFGGGVITLGGARFQALLYDTLSTSCPQARLTAVTLPPEAGAVVLAAHRSGRDWNAVFAALQHRLSAREMSA